MQIETFKIYDEDGGWDLCECVKGDTRVLRVLESHRVPTGDGSNHNAILYAHACGYKD